MFLMNRTSPLIGHQLMNASVLWWQQRDVQSVESDDFDDDCDPYASFTGIGLIFEMFCWYL
jgi:hypothetical protein